MAQQESAVDRSTALYERPTMDIVDAATFAEVKQAIASAFAAGHVETFLKSLQSSGLRVRDFEAVLTAGKLGSATIAQYGKLAGGDQGQIREFYLASLEQIDAALRDKFFKLYAYY